MSMVVRTPSGKLCLMVKGADSMVLPMVSAEGESLLLAKEATAKLASRGSRTLVVAGH